MNQNFISIKDVKDTYKEMPNQQSLGALENPFNF